MIIILETDLTCIKYKIIFMKKEDLQSNSQKTVLILDNIRSILNVGAIFRTADAFGISKIYLCGITPSPVDRFGRKRNDLHKTALGAEESVLWEENNSTFDVAQNLKKEGYKIISLEQSENSKDYKEINISEKTAVVLGSETEGVSEDVLKISDAVAEIKMLGSKESLNVSVSAGILLSRILNI
jgi:23S rRNA (guanosine2251-2'-O)-methyltransferase